jgi:hypothetical protein
MHFPSRVGVGIFAGFLLGLRAQPKAGSLTTSTQRLAPRVRTPTCVRCDPSIICQRNPLEHRVQLARFRVTTRVLASGGHGPVSPRREAWNPEACKLNPVTAALVRLRGQAGGTWGRACQATHQVENSTNPACRNLQLRRCVFNISHWVPVR